MTSTDPAGSSPPGPSPAVRASDAERESFARTVTTGSQEGRLSVTEADERIRQIYAATYREELPKIVVDLPRETWPTEVTDTPARPAARSAPPATVWRGGLVVHAVVVAVLAVAAISAWRHSGVPFFWPAWPLTWLGVSVFVHYRMRLRRQRWRGDWAGRRPGNPEHATMPAYRGPWSSNRGDRDAA